MTYQEEVEYKINQAIKNDPKAKEFEQRLRDVQQKIEDAYGIPIYYLWNTGELVWEKPNKLHSPLYKPDYTPSVMGIEIGSLVAQKDLLYHGFCGQVSFISISQNRIETQKGPQMRGSGAGSSLDIIPKLKVLVTGSKLVELYEAKGY